MEINDAHACVKGGGGVEGQGGCRGALSAARVGQRNGEPGLAAGKQGGYPHPCGLMALRAPGAVATPGPAPSGARGGGGGGEPGSRRSPFRTSRRSPARRASVRRPCRPPQCPTCPACGAAAAQGLPGPSRPAPGWGIVPRAAAAWARLARRPPPLPRPADPTGV